MNLGAPDTGRLRRANVALLGLVAMGVLVWLMVWALTGHLALGVVYGLAPGIALGCIARIRILRGALFKRESTQGNRDRETA